MTRIERIVKRLDTISIWLIQPASHKTLMIWSIRLFVTAMILDLLRDTYIFIILYAGLLVATLLLPYLWLWRRGRLRRGGR